MHFWGIFRRSCYITLTHRLNCVLANEKLLNRSLINIRKLNILKQTSTDPNRLRTLVVQKCVVQILEL